LIGSKDSLIIISRPMMLFPTYSRADGREKADGGTLGTQFNQIKKKENETVKEFISIFDRLYNQIPTDYRPTTSSVRLLYMNAFEGKF
jgi:hypothetical protein